MKRSIPFNPDNRPATWDQIKHWRDVHEVAPVTTSFGPFDADERSEARMKGSIERFDSLPTLDVDNKLTWKLADNTYLKVTKADLTSIYNEVQELRAVRGALLHVKGEQFRSQPTPPTPNELKNLTFWIGA